ncbi:MAG: 5-formyltetrahydrofolate cyclo-ligase [Clostridium sp.]
MEKSAISKVELRTNILEQRKTLTIEDTGKWDAQIKARLLLLEPLAKEQTNTIYCYISVRGETGTEELIRHYLADGFRVAVPRVKGKSMDFYYIKSYDDLKPGGFGIPEPDLSCEKADCETAPVIAPGVAFSRLFERTGYGAGYYDRFFEQEPNHEKIAICYHFQLVDAIAVEAHDIQMDYIVTSEECLCRKEN